MYSECIARLELFKKATTLVVLAVIAIIDFTWAQQVKERAIPVEQVLYLESPFPLKGEAFSRYFLSFTNVSRIPHRNGEVRYTVSIPKKETGFKLTVLDRFKVTKIEAFALPDDLVYKIELILSSPLESTLIRPELHAQFRQEVEDAMGNAVKAERRSAGRVRRGDATYEISRWGTPAVQVTACEEPDKNLWMEILNPAHLDKGGFGGSSKALQQAVRPSSVEVDLDSLLALDKVWSLSAEDFEKIYRPKTPKFQREPPHFEWLEAEKKRARFSRKLTPKVDTQLTMFAKAIKVDEVVVEFVNGKAARATVVFYNRGDSGEISPVDFNDTFRKVGQNLGQVLKVAPSNALAVASTAVKTVTWQWKSPLGIALLEHNDYAAAGEMGKPEFLRLKLASPDQADWSMGKLAVGVQKMELLKNITKTASGDVYIAGVPMVDQGAKGYCVAASCQRLFEYMQIPCDQHEIAQLVSADAESGSNILTMQKSLAKIDGQFKVTFRPFMSPELMSSGRKPRVSLRQFVVAIKEQTSKGIPLLWALQLGFPETPSLPNGGQVRGGHMRLVIGYNQEKGEILFTDSWGAGHELKRMSEANAYEATLGLYSMAPRGL